MGGARDRSEGELYQEIATVLSAASHRRVHVVINGGIQIGLPETPLATRMGATREPARSVLTRALQLHHVKRTWALLHSPEDGGNDEFYLNVRDLAENQCR